MECPSCGGRVRLKTFACNVHKSCTTTKKADGVACCAGCKEYATSHGVPDAGSALWVNMGAGGIGDGVQGLLAVVALKAADPPRRVVYGVGPKALPFVALFDGYDHLVPYDFDGGYDDGPNTGGVQLNLGYKSGELAGRGSRPKISRYLRNAGGVAPVFPSLRDRAGLLSRGRGFAGAVALCPFSDGEDREWSLPHWLALESLLAKKGYRTVILTNARNAGRASAFASEKLVGAAAEAVVGCLLNCACAVGADSGLSHLCGVLGVPCVVLCGQTSGWSTFECYPTARWLQGELPCSGCYWNPPYGDHCRPRCPSLQTITPGRVLAIVDEMALPALAGDRTLLSADRLAVLRDLLLDTAGLPGDLAELGVYRGGVAKLMGTFSPGSRVHLFDTFCGTPEDDLEPAGHRKGDFADTSLMGVLDFLDNKNARAYQARFPELLPPGDTRYRLVHMDGDLYQSVRAAIHYFVPRLVPGGVVVFDDLDWPGCPGVRRALDELLPGQVTVSARHQGVYRRPT